MNVNLSY